MSIFELLNHSEIVYFDEYTRCIVSYKDYNFFLWQQKKNKFSIIDQIIIDDKEAMLSIDNKTLSVRVLATEYYLYYISQFCSSQIPKLKLH